MTEPHVIATIRKNNIEEVRISLTSYLGFDFVDIRTHVDFDGSRGEEQATRKGICLGVNRLPELITALTAAKEASR